LAAPDRGNALASPDRMTPASPSQHAPWSNSAAFTALGGVPQVFVALAALLALLLASVPSLP